MPAAQEVQELLDVRDDRRRCPVLDHMCCCCMYVRKDRNSVLGNR